MIRAEGSSHRILNLMIQAQELVMTKAQQSAANSDVGLDALQESIDAMLAELPEDYGTAFRRLIQRDNIAIVPVTAQGCSACAMGVPVGTVNAIRAADRIFTCPACARYLYVAEGQPKGVRPRKSGAAKPIVGVTRFSGQELMLPDIAPRTRDEAIALICANLKKQGFIDDDKRLAREALKREGLASTAVGNAIAFPHVRGIEGGGLTLSVATSRKGVDFDGASPMPRVIFFMVIPTAASAFYLKLLAGLSKTFSDKEARDALLEMEDAAALWKALVKLTKKAIP